MEAINRPVEHRPNEYSGFGKALGIAEAIAIALVLIGFCFRLVFILPGASLFWIGGFFILSIVYFPLSLVYAGISGKYPKAADKALMMMCGLMLSGGCMGLLFCLQQWPGGKMNVYVALLVWVPTLIVALLGAFKAINIVPAATKWVLTRALVIALPLWFMVFVGPVELFGLMGMFRNNPKYMELYAQCYKQRNRAACDELNRFHMTFDIIQDMEKRERMLNGGEWID